MTRVPHSTPSVNDDDVQHVLRRDYPTNLVGDILSLPEDEVRAIYDKDWRQYSESLTRA